MPAGVTTTASCHARTALAGNPSDGHGGAVVATIIPSIAATVSVAPADRFHVDGTDLHCRTVDELDERAGELATVDQPLVPAALVAMRRHLGARIDPIAVDVETTIPRSLGLAGSSAIVLATIRAIVARHPDRAWAGRITADPALPASVALAAETDVLGISAGLQDRVAQSFDGTMAMEFGGPHRRSIAGLMAGSYRRLGPLPPGMFVACRPSFETHSGQVHSANDLRDPSFLAAMERCAAEARRAAAAIADGDRATLGVAMDATFDLRASVMELHRGHVQMVDVARAAGASANYTGSGGAIVVLPRDRATAGALRQALVDELGCVLFDLPSAEPDRRAVTSRR